MEEEGVKPFDMRRNLPPLRNERDVDDLGNSERFMYEALCRNEVPVVCIIVMLIRFGATAQFNIFSFFAIICV